MSRLVIGTRGSDLARWQAGHVERLLRAAHHALQIETVVIESDGDIEASAPIAHVGGTGVFVRRLETALLEGQVDIAVHSLKDMPTQQPEGLDIVAIPERHDPRDTLLSVEGWTLEQLPPGTVVGTGSPRRRSQLLHARPDLEFVPVRGNVDTRLRKLLEGQFGALVLAQAALERLGLDEVPARPLDLERCLPAVGQGALAIEARNGDPDTLSVVAVLNHTQTVSCVQAERAFLRRLGGGCLAPAAAHARHLGGQLVLDARVANVEGAALIGEREAGDPVQANKIGERLAERLLVAGADVMLERSRQALG